MEIFFIALLTLVASAIGTMTGFGTSTIMIPILVLFFPPTEAIFLVAIIHWFGDLWKVTLFRKGFHVKLIVLFGISGLLASSIGASISIGFDKEILLRFLGGFLAGYAIFLLVKSTFTITASHSTALIGGVLSGFFAGMFGIGGAIRGMFLSAFNLPKAVYIATAGAIGLMVDATRIVTYVTSGMTLSKTLWWSLLLFIPISFLGAQCGKKIIDTIPQEKFRIGIAIFLFLIGIKLFVFPI